MSSVTIITDLFRASHAHLKIRKKFNDKDEPAFRIAALFPQDGIGQIEALGIQFESSPLNIITAIKEVVMSEFGFEYDENNEQNNKANGVQFSPMLKDGNLVLKKDSNGQPIPNEHCPISSGNFIFNMKNVEPVGCANGVTLKEIDPAACYAGCWGRSQLEISAYSTKTSPPARIISVKLINFQMCYDDESFGGRGPVQSAEDAFKGMAVTDSNLSVSTGNTQFRPEVSKPIQKTPPRSLTGTVTMNADSEYTYQQLLDGDFTDQDMIDGGYATKAIVKKVLPAKKSPPMKKSMIQKTPPRSLTGTVTMNPDCTWTYQELLDEGFTDQDMIDGGHATKATAAPMKKSPPAKKFPPPKKTPPMKSVPTTGTVIMNDDSEYTYKELSIDFGWTDDEIVNGGFAKPNFTNPQ